MGSLLNRTILIDLIKIFVLALTGITGLLLLAVVIIEAQNQGLTPAQILTIIPLVIPSTLPYTIPATTLFATCVVYGRMANDNEILAIKSAGINVMHVIRPALILGLLMSLLTGALFYHVIPSTYHTMKTVFLNDIEAVIYGILKRHSKFVDPKMDYEIYVTRVEGKKLIDPVFLHRNKKTGVYDLNAQAKEAEILVDNAHRKVFVTMRHCHISGPGGEKGFVDEQIWEVDLPADMSPATKERRSFMTWRELQTKLQQLFVERDDIEAQIALTASAKTIGQSPSNLQDHLRNLANVKRLINRQILEIRGEMHRRPALAMGCLFFVLIGCPVGIWFSRSDYLSAFVTCFLPIVIVYYPLQICSDNLARNGTIPPMISHWAPNAVMGIVAIFLYRRLLKH